MTTSPPSPVVICLPCCRLKQPTAPIVPTSRPALRARNACAQSSITGMPRAAATARDRVELARVAEQVRHDDRGGAIREPAAIGRGGDVAGARVDVGEDRDRALVEDRRERTHVGDRRGDDLVAGLRVDRRRSRRGPRRCPTSRRPPSRTPSSAANRLLELGDLRSLRARQRAAADHVGQAGDLGFAQVATGCVLIIREREPRSVERT